MIAPGKLSLGISLAVLSFAGCRREKASEPVVSSLPSAQVRIALVEKKSHQASEEIVGTVQPRLRAAIETKVSGRIEKMLAAPGKSVKSGELLVELDAREIQARLDQASASRDQAARDMTRLRKLLTEKTVSPQEFEVVELRHRVAAAAVTEAETMLAYTRITAPFTGVITRKLADVGDQASPGRVLLEMEDPGNLRLEAAVPEGLINRVKLGESLNLRASPSDSPVRAAVGEIAPSADPVTRTFNIKLDLPPGSGFRAGQFARVSIPLGETLALVVPSSAVTERGQLETVFVAADQKARLRLVKTGKRFGNEVELVSGVNAGESVIVDPPNQLRDGQPVEVRQ